MRHQESHRKMKQEVDTLSPGTEKDVADRGDEKPWWSEQHGQILVELAAPIMWRASADGRMEGDNLVWRAYTGQSEQEMGGWGWLKAIHPHDRQRIRRLWSQASASGNSIETEYLLRRSDGVYRSFLVRALSTTSEDGRIQNWIGVSTDITEQRRLEEALQEYEQRFRYTFEQASVGMMHIDIDGNVQYVNQRLCDIVGFSREELVRGPLKWMTHPDDRVEDEVYMRAVLVEGKLLPYEREKRYLRKDGSYVWVQITSNPVYDSDHNILYFAAVVQGISQHKELEARLQRVAEEAQERAGKLEAIINAMTDHVMVYDKVGHLQHINFLTRDLLEHTAPPDYVSRELKDRVSDLRDEEGKPLPQEKWPLTRILQGEIIKGTQAVDVFFGLPSGDVVEVSLSGAPIRNRDGEIVGAICIWRDVTARHKLERRTQEALNALVAMAKTLVQISPQSERFNMPTETLLLGKRIVELTQRLLDFQHTGILAIKPVVLPLVASLGFTLEEDQRWFTTIENGEANLATLLEDPFVQARLQTNEIIVFDVTQPIFRRIAHILDVHSAIVAPIQVEGQLVGVLYADHGSEEHRYKAGELALVEAMTQICALVIVRERDAAELMKALTALQETNTHLDQVNRMQNNFISLVGHEFRTTLTGIQGFSELLRDEAFDIIEVKEYATDIHDDALRLSRMITDLLDLERMKSGKMTLYLEKVDLNAMLTDIAERARLTATRHAISLQLDETLFEIDGDRDKLIQVVTNLMSNAVKYAPSGGEILLRSINEGKYAHIIVQDQGIGIPPEALEKVFLPYSRIDSEKTRYVQGTGLGLPIVRQIVEMHDGKAWAESKPGQGTQLHFTIPVVYIPSAIPKE